MQEIFHFIFVTFTKTAGSDGFLKKRLYIFNKNRLGFLCKYYDFSLRENFSRNYPCFFSGFKVFLNYEND